MSSASAAKKSGASFARGASKQDYSTPRVFLNAVRKRFGPTAFDLAAVYENAVADKFFGPPKEIAGYESSYGIGCMGVDSLAQDWSKLRGHLWLNPPFDRIEPWAEKCAKTRSGRIKISFLVPASVGSEWWAKHVHGRARIYFLRPRLSFDGKNPYPKDCALCRYSDTDVLDYSCWRWDA